MQFGRLPLFVIYLLITAPIVSYGAKERRGCSEAFQALYEKLDVDTLVGSHAQVGYVTGRYLSPEQRERITAEGVVIREYQAGADILEPATGKVHIIHTSDVEVEYLRCGKAVCSWTHTSNDVPGLKENLQTTQNAFGIVHISDHNGEYSYAGEISWVKNGYNELVQVKDLSGQTHTFDPRYFFLDVYITEGGKVDKTVYAKYPNSKDPSYGLTDPTFNSRMEMVSELTKAGKYFEDAKLYEYLEGHPTESLWMIKKSYPRSWQFIETVETQVGKKYAVLLVDPGIATRVSDFTEFAKTYVKQHPGVSPAELREAFSKHLGTQKVYYASFFDAQELAGIPSNGVKVAPLTANENTARLALAGIFEPYTSYPKQPWAKYLGEDLFAHRIQGDSPTVIDLGVRRSRPYPLKIEPENWLTLHSSAYPQVATAFGYYGPNGFHYGDNAKKTFALVEAEVPTISVVKAVGPFVDFKHAGSNVEMQFPGRTISLQKNPNAEVFIPFSIPPSAIRSVKPFDAPPPKPGLVVTP